MVCPQCLAEVRRQWSKKNSRTEGAHTRPHLGTLFLIRGDGLMLPGKLATGWQVPGARVSSPYTNWVSFIRSAVSGVRPRPTVEDPSVCLTVEPSVLKSPFGILVCSQILVVWTSGEVVRENGQGSLSGSREGQLLWLYPWRE